MKKDAYYGSGYGHGGRGYTTRLDQMGQAPKAPDKVPTWALIAGGLGAGALGFAGLRRLFRGGGGRAAAGAADDVARGADDALGAMGTPGNMSAGEMAMLGRVNPRYERIISDSAENAAARQRAAAHAKSVEQIKNSSVIGALGQIARGD